MANYFCCIQTFSFKLLICSQTFIKPKHVQKPEILYEFDIRFHTKVRKFNNSCFTNCTKHALDLYTNKTNRIDRHKPITTELGQDETLTVAYNFRETKSCNHFFFYFSVAKTVAKSSQVHVWLEEKNFEVLKRCLIEMYIQLVFCCVMEKLLIFYICEILEWSNIKFL